MTPPIPSERILVACAADSAARPDLEALAVHLMQAGAAVTLAIVDLSEPHAAERPGPGGGLRLLRVGAPSFPLVCGLGRSGETAALREAYALAHALAEEPFDLAVCPLSGGLAHGLLMSRATGASDAIGTVALWLDAPARWDVLEEDRSPADLAPLVRDAMERVALRLADAMIAPHAEAAGRLRGLPEAPPIVWTAMPLALGPARRDEAGAAVAEIVFVGPLSRRAGALAFMDAIEDLSRRGVLADRLVTFLGPVPDARASLGASMLGIRAQRWPFRLKVIDTADEARILSYLGEPGRLAVFAGHDPGSGRLFRSVLARGVGVVATSAYGISDDGGRHPVSPDSRSLGDGIAAALADGGAVAHGETGMFREVLPALRAIPRRAPSRAPRRVRSVSVCLTHRFRPALLAKALASIAASPEIEVEAVVIDNGGDPPFVPPGSEIRVVRLDRPLPQAAACNRGVAAARGEIVVFLDDDNLLAEGGLDRFVDALSTGWFDLAVTSLELIDGEAGNGRAGGRTIFIGDAGMAGLFFNGFGDTAFAIRRDAFLAIGGFREWGHLAPVLDWEFLARARAGGFRIGTIQNPAIRYARRIGGESINWLKLDRDGGRRAVLEAYGENVDGALVGRYAQGLQARE